MQYSKFPQLPHRPLRGILISGSPHREFRVSCFHCLKNFTSAERCALPFIKAKVCQTETKENEASLFLFDFYIHTCIAISSVRLQAKPLLALTYIFIYCFFLFSLCLTWKFISQLTVDNFCSRKVFYIDMYIYYTWKKMCACVWVHYFLFIQHLCDFVCSKAGHAWAFEKKIAGEHPDVGKDSVNLRWWDCGHFLDWKKSVVYHTLSSVWEGEREVIRW